MTASNVKKRFVTIVMPLSVCMVTTLIVQPKVMKTYKNLPGNIPNNFPYQNIILSLRNYINQTFFVWWPP